MIKTIATTTLMLLAGASLLYAQAQPAVHEIEIFADITGNSYDDAKARALDYAQKRAFYLMLHKLVPAEKDTIVRGMTSEQILQQARGVNVAQERYLEDQNRYQAQIFVAFSDPAIKRMLGTAPLEEDAPVKPIVEAGPSALLVLPVLERNGELLLWDGSNVWRSIWNSVALEKGLGSLVMPFGDPVDIGLVDHTTVLARNYDDLKPLLERYGTKQAAVVLARYDTDQTPVAINVTVRQMGQNIDRVKDINLTADNSDQTPELLLIQASRLIADQLKFAAEEQKAEEQKAKARAKQKQLKAYFRRLPDWVELQELLKTLPTTADIEVSNITINSADVILYHNTTDALLERSMQVHGIKLRKLPGVWQVSLE